MNVLFRLTKRKEFDRKCALSDREMIRYTLWSAVWCILTQLQGSFWVYFCSRPKRRIKTWFRTCGCVRYARYTQYMNNNFNQNNKHKNRRRSEGLNHESSNSILFSLDSKWLPPKPKKIWKNSSQFNNFLSHLSKLLIHNATDGNIKRQIKQIRWRRWHLTISVRLFIK